MKIEDISEQHDTFDTKVILTYTDHGEEKVIEGMGNGSHIDAVKHGLCQQAGYNTILTLYTEHALTKGSDSQAASYIELDGCRKRKEGLWRRRQLRILPVPPSARSSVR